jgi:2-polyprenyl-3-methyl-5-hydroxy-6-metoxy-1,4-benzoquinol methylase
VPTAHDEPPIYLEIFRDLFSLPKVLIFNTTEEQDFVNQRFGTQHILQDVVGVGVEAPLDVSAERFLAQHAQELEEREFILYVGRVDASKGCRQLCSHFMRFREDVPAHPLKLVMLGSPAMEIPPHPDILALGFVSDRDKYDAIAAAQVVMLPSPYESLSIVALEAWQQGKPVLANGTCAVLRGQCKRSNGGLWYDNYAEFQETLSLLLQEPLLRQRLGAAGRSFVQRNYHWRYIESKYIRLLKLSLSGTSGEGKLGSLTPEHVVWGYRLFLDREPENDQIVMDKFQRLASIQELRQEFIRSSDFKQKNPGLPMLSGNEPQMLIDDACSEHDLHILFDHIQEAWQYFGLTEPHYSVLTWEQFLQVNIQKTRDAFYNTGKQDVLRLFNTLDRNGVDYSSYKSCLEYGCGLGRVTRWLAERFETVFGYDISQSHLQYAKSYFSDENICNVSFFHIRHLEDIQNIQRVDLIYSIIVLQHNPPPIIAMIIREFIKKLNSGGIAFFQVPTYRIEYSFSIENYLKGQTKRHEIEMHVLPQAKIFDIIRQGGGRVIEVLEDDSTGLSYKEVSNTFLLQKE